MCRDRGSDVKEAYRFASKLKKNHTDFCRKMDTNEMAKIILFLLKKNLGYHNSSKMI